MIEQPVGDLPARVPRRLVARAVLRAVLTSTALVLLYFTLPFTGSLDSFTVFAAAYVMLADAQPQAFSEP
jgi:hypothetical protein